MKKIGFDINNGVYDVLEFEPGTAIITKEEVFTYLAKAEEGRLFGCIVDEKTYKQINEEYKIT